ncbi:hypothetical protein GDO78_016744 [Eleutherodactylus coqui]|uniref:Uncharacterized protein n=1 Tax=Eleutherodactylus coqui TaxID=57060 RepID=A0A8J6BE95_ELECQ|nr:hypothetical protein GDO78_016744 [Eleutherodactylus coqui]
MLHWLPDPHMRSLARQTRIMMYTSVYPVLVNLSQLSPVCAWTNHAPSVVVWACTFLLGVVALVALRLHAGYRPVPSGRIVAAFYAIDWGIKKTILFAKMSSVAPSFY